MSIHYRDPCAAASPPILKGRRGKKDGPPLRWSKGKKIVSIFFIRKNERLGKKEECWQKEKRKKGFPLCIWLKEWEKEAL